MENQNQSATVPKAAFFFCRYSIATLNAGLADRQTAILPLPSGEGRGEGDSAPGSKEFANSVTGSQNS
jgi:hypothetical protein